MDMIPLKPERRAQLEEYAKRRGLEPAAALDDVLATYLEWEQQDSTEAAAAIRRGYEDVKAGRSRPRRKSLRTSGARISPFHFKKLLDLKFLSS